MTDVYGAKPDLDTAGGDVNHRTAGEIEDGIYPFVLERFDNESVAVDLRHYGHLLGWFLTTSAKPPALSKAGRGARPAQRTTTLPGAAGAGRGIR